MSRRSMKAVINVSCIIKPIFETPAYDFSQSLPGLVEAF